MFIEKDGVKLMATVREGLLPNWVNYLSDEDRRRYEKLKHWMNCALENMLKLEELVDREAPSSEMKARVRAKIQAMTRCEVGVAGVLIRQIYPEAETAYKFKT